MIQDNTINLAEELRNGHKEKTQEFFNDLLVGQKIKKAYDNILILENGVKLTLFESRGDHYAGAYGYWDIINGSQEAGITNVEIEKGECCNNKYSFLGNYIIITILHDNNLIVKGEGVASAGNSGYYFSTLSLKIELNDQVIEKELLYS